MKNKSVLIGAGIVVVVLTAILFVIVFSMQYARAEQPLEMEEPAEELPQEIVTEEPTEIPEKEADIAEEAEPAPPEEPAEQPEAPIEEEELSAEEDPAELKEPAEDAIFESELTISCFTQSEKKLKESEVVEGNWKTKKPSAADITEEQAIETAKHAGKEIFGLKDLEVKTAEFQKDMTGQRGSHWLIRFKEDDLLIEIDSLSGNIARVHSDIRRSDKTKRENLGEAGFSKKMNEIVAAEDSEQGGEYTAATKAIAEKYISGKVKGYQLNAVHGDGEHYPLVSIDVEMENGEIYEFEWSRANAEAEMKICSMDAFSSRDHFRAWVYWDADLLMNGENFA